MTKSIPISRDMSVLVDDEDFDLASSYNWQATQCGAKWYAQCKVTRGGKRRSVTLHRLLMGAPAGSHVEHKDGNGLNNTRANLQLKSGYGEDRKFHGVYRSPRRYRAEWRAYIIVEGRQRHIGYFITEEGAALGYNEAAMRYYGEAARLNELTKSKDEIIAAEAQRFVWYPQLDQSSPYRGVNFMNNRSSCPCPWRARIRIAERVVHIGSFPTEIEAAMAYNEKALELHGARAILNRIPAVEAAG